MAKRSNTAPHRRLTVRMYREILGDCFLIRAPKDGGTINVLIDCGILQGTERAADRARRIMTDVAAETGNHLDVLIVTHEHWDHLSGFAQAKDVFDGIAVSELWLGWTEDPRDELARKLSAGRAQALSVVCRGRDAALAMSSPSRSEFESELEQEDDHSPIDMGFAELLSFNGIDPGETGPGLAARARATTATILDGLRTKAGAVRYFRPGVDPVPVTGLPDLRAFVLGPPRDETLLKRSAPRKGTQEVYQLAAGDVDDLFHLAALDMDGGGAASADVDLALPFGKRLLMMRPPHPVPPASTSEEMESRRSFEAVYDDPAEEWRKIEQDWLLAGEQLALKLDNDTNNTSLAIAFEIGAAKDARVMLFPGDAQVGSWLSWSSLSWDVKDPDGERRVTIEDLFARTVLYKVGHHGSHNATLRERGLELMTSRDLVAMVPVVESFANDAVKNWNMPFPSLLKRLEEKTGRRVLRADRGVAHFEDIARDVSGKPGELGGKEWELFRGAVREISDRAGPIAIEFAIDM